MVVARHGERIDDLEERFNRHESQQNGALEKIWKKLDGINEELRGRPTWGTALLITSLVGVVVSLAAFIVTRGG